MAITTFRNTSIFIIARGTNRDGSRNSIIVPLALNLPINLFIVLVNITLAIFTTCNQIADEVVRLADDIYRFLFVGWEDDWPIIWLAIRQIVGGAYVGE